MISGLADLYVLCVGLLYPAYKMLQAYDASCSKEEVEIDFWQKYFIVFSIVYVSSEIMEWTASLLMPFIALAQFVGVSCLVWPETNITQTLYNKVILPLYDDNKNHRLSLMHPPAHFMQFFSIFFTVSNNTEQDEKKKKTK
jgi:hypothetical protein